MAARPIVVVGSVHMDLVAQAQRLPHVGETVSGNAFTTRPGGKGLNQALAAARLGARVSFVGCHGRDHFGRETREALERSGVDIRHLRAVDSEPTGIGSVLMDASGEYVTIMVDGANLCLTEQDIIKASETSFPIGCITLLQCEIAYETSGAAARVTRARQGMVIWNAAPAPAGLPPELAPHVDILVVSAGEAQQLTGLDDATDAAKSLATVVPTVVVTRGADGVVVDATGHVTSYPAPPVTAVDTLGAGDIFVGALTYALSEGSPLSVAVRLATATASLTVSKGGGIAGMPSMREINRLLS